MRPLSLAALFALVGTAGCIEPAPTTFVPEAASYQLHVDEVVRRIGEPPTWGDDASILVHAEARLDLQQAADGTWSARVSPEWRPSAMYSVESTAEGVVLVPEGDAASFTGYTGGAGAFARASLDRIVLDATIAPDGLEWTGAFTLESTESELLGDVIASRETVVDGTGRVDDVAPEVRLARVARSTPLLPWEPVRALFSEPIGIEDLENHLPLGVATDHAVGSDVDLVTDVLLFPGGHAAPSWWSSPHVDFTIIAGITDLAGNAALASTLSEERVADVSAASFIDFETSTESATFWGSEPGEVVPPCPSGTGCLALSQPSFSAAGIFARLSHDGPITRVSFTMRAYEIDPPIPGRPLEVQMEVAREPEDASGLPIVIASSEASVAISADGALGDTGVVTLTIDLAEAAEDIGLAISFTDPTDRSMYGDEDDELGVGGPPVPGLGTLAIVVDDITVE